MPLGIISDEDFEKELGNTTNGVVIPVEKGRGNSPGVPESLQKIIGENAIEEGNKATEVLTDFLGISNSSLTAYKNGATSTASYHDGKGELKDHTNNARNAVATRARNKLMNSLAFLTKDKLEAAKAKDLAGIARDMSVIIKNMEPEVSKESTNQTFILYAPRPRLESEFEVIDVGE